MRGFRSYHPVVNFTYFAVVILLSVCLMHPVCLGLSLVCSMIYAVLLKGQKAMRFFLWMLPVPMTAILINPIFNHKGVTVLGHFPGGNPFTLESAVYGAAAAAMLLAVLGWFFCWNEIMTGEKLVYLFGRITPGLALVFSMTLGFVPRFRRQMQITVRAQQGIEGAVSGGSVAERGKRGVQLFSMLVTWALENAVETADSMRSRGYGLPGRSTFSVFRFETRDGLVLAGLVGCSLFIGGMCLFGNVDWQYFPDAAFALWGWRSISLFAAYFLLCMLPVLIEIREVLRWTA